RAIAENLCMNATDDAGFSAVCLLQLQNRSRDRAAMQHPPALRRNCEPQALHIPAALLYGRPKTGRHRTRRMRETGGRKPPLVADRRYGTQPKAAPKPKAAAKPRAARRPSRRAPWPARLAAGLFRAVWRVIWGIGWRIAAMGAIVTGLATLYFYAQLPPLEALIDARTRGSVTMLDREGQVFAWRGETFGGTITADTVSPDLKNAIVATEDKRFYRHLGISPRGIASAVRINLAEGRGPLEGNGGSTITQQVAKLICLGVPYDPKTWKSEADYEADCRQSSLMRKIKEVPFSFAMEAKYGKD